MGKCIVKQPNGMYAVWSTVVDDFVLMDATLDEVAASFIEDRVRDVMRNMRRYRVELAERGSTSMMGRTWDSCIEDIQEGKGEEVAKQRRDAGTRDVPAWILRDAD